MDSSVNGKQEVERAKCVTALIGMHYRKQTVDSSYQVSDTNINGDQPF